MPSMALSLNITAQEAAPINAIPPDAITDEAGQPITDESGNPITDD